MRDDPELQVMAGVAGTVAALALLRPRLLARVLLADPDELTGLGRFALRLFATRNVWVVVESARGNPTAQGALPADPGARPGRILARGADRGHPQAHDGPGRLGLRRDHRSRPPADSAIAGQADARAASRRT